MHPKYAIVPGDIVYANGLQHNNALVRHYLVKSDVNAQQALCNSWFNVPWQRQFNLRANCPVILVSFLNSSCSLGICERDVWVNGGCPNGNCASSMLCDQKDNPLGYFKFNMLKVSMLLKGNGDLPYVFSPYIFCDDGTITANLRETMGWNVLFAELNFDLHVLGKDDPSSFSFVCAMDVPRMETYATPPPPEQFVVLDAGTPEAGGALTFFDARDSLTRFPAYLDGAIQAHGATANQQQSLHLTQAILGYLDRISLRQFRGTLSGERAILQNVQAAKRGLFTQQSGGVIPGGQQMHFLGNSTMAELHFPLRKDLGLAADSTVIAGFWSLSNFTYRPKSVQWSGVQQNSR